MPPCHCFQLCLDSGFNLRTDQASRTLLITDLCVVAFAMGLDVVVCKMCLTIDELRRLNYLIHVNTQNSNWQCFCCYMLIIIRHPPRNSGLQLLMLKTVQFNCQRCNLFQRLGCSQVACTIMTSAQGDILLLQSGRLTCTF